MDYINQKKYKSRIYLEYILNKNIDIKILSKFDKSFFDEKMINKYCRIIIKIIYDSLKGKNVDSRFLIPDNLKDNIYFYHKCILLNEQKLLRLFDIEVISNKILNDLKFEDFFDDIDDFPIDWEVNDNLLYQLLEYEQYDLIYKNYKLRDIIFNNQFIMNYNGNIKKLLLFFLFFKELKNDYKYCQPLGYYTAKYDFDTRKKLITEFYKYNLINEDTIEIIINCFCYKRNIESNGVLKEQSILDSLKENKYLFLKILENSIKRNITFPFENISVIEYIDELLPKFKLNTILNFLIKVYKSYDKQKDYKKNIIKNKDLIFNILNNADQYNLLIFYIDIDTVCKLELTESNLQSIYVFGNEKIFNKDLLKNFINHKLYSCIDKFDSFDDEIINILKKVIDNKNYKYIKEIFKSLPCCSARENLEEYLFSNYSIRTIYSILEIMPNMNYSSNYIKFIENKFDDINENDLIYLVKLLSLNKQIYNENIMRKIEKILFTKCFDTGMFLNVFPYLPNKEYSEQLLEYIINNNLYDAVKKNYCNKNGSNGEIFNDKLFTNDIINLIDSKIENESNNKLLYFILDEVPKDKRTKTMFNYVIKFNVKELKLLSLFPIDIINENYINKYNIQQLIDLNRKLPKHLISKKILSLLLNYSNFNEEILIQFPFDLFTNDMLNKDNLFKFLDITGLYLIKYRNLNNIKLLKLVIDNEKYEYINYFPNYLLTSNLLTKDNVVCILKNINSIPSQIKTSEVALLFLMDKNEVVPYDKIIHFLDVIGEYRYLLNTENNHNDYIYFNELKLYYSKNIMQNKNILEEKSISLFVWKDLRILLMCLKDEKLYKYLFNFEYGLFKNFDIQLNIINKIILIFDDIPRAFYENEKVFEYCIELNKYDLLHNFNILNIDYFNVLFLKLNNNQISLVLENINKNMLSKLYSNSGKLLNNKGINLDNILKDEKIKKLK